MTICTMFLVFTFFRSSFCQIRQSAILSRHDCAFFLAFAIGMGIPRISKLVMFLAMFNNT